MQRLCQLKRVRDRHTHTYVYVYAESAFCCISQFSISEHSFGFTGGDLAVARLSIYGHLVDVDQLRLSHFLSFYPSHCMGVLRPLLFTSIHLYRVDRLQAPKQMHFLEWVIDLVNLPHFFLQPYIEILVMYFCCCIVPLSVFLVFLNVRTSISNQTFRTTENLWYALDSWSYTSRIMLLIVILSAAFLFFALCLCRECVCINHSPGQWLICRII